jgi:hypothetical protein
MIMGLFDRFKKKAEELYNNVASSIQGIVNRNEKVDTVSTIPTEPVGKSTAIAIGEHLKKIDNTYNLDDIEIPKHLLEKRYINPDKKQPEGKLTAPISEDFDNIHKIDHLVLPKGVIKKPIVDKNDHLTFFKKPEYISDLAKMKNLMKNRDLDVLESEESQLIVRAIKGIRNSLEHKSSFVNDVEYNAKLEELIEINRAYSNKIQTMRNEHDVAEKILGETMLLKDKDSLPLDEGTLLHRISGWNRVKNTVDNYKDHYEFYSEKDEAVIKQAKSDVEDNKYITCAKLISAETTLSRLDLNDYHTLQRIKDEFDKDGLNGPTFKKVLEGVAAYREFTKMEDNFKTPRMLGTAESFKELGMEFEKIAVSLQQTGSIPQLEKGFDMFKNFDDLESKRQVKNDAPVRPKATLY